MVEIFGSWENEMWWTTAAAKKKKKKEKDYGILMNYFYLHLENYETLLELIMIQFILLYFYIIKAHIH